MAAIGVHREPPPVSTSDPIELMERADTGGGGLNLLLFFQFTFFL